METIRTFFLKKDKKVEIVFFLYARCVSYFSQIIKCLLLVVVIPYRKAGNIHSIFLNHVCILLRKKILHIKYIL